MKRLMSVLVGCGLLATLPMAPANAEKLDRSDQSVKVRIVQVHLVKGSASDLAIKDPMDRDHGP